MKKQNIKMSLKGNNHSHECFIFLVESSFTEIKSYLFEILSPEEQKIFEKIPSQIRQHHYLLGRYSAKSAFSKIYPVPINKIFIESGIFHQPVIMYPRESCFQVSVSHTKNISASIAFPETHPMGIDIEEISYKNNHAITSQMTDKEIKILNTKDIPTALTVAWTAKEALSKVLRCGLMIPFNLLEISSYQENHEYVDCFFSNFSQYKSLSWKHQNFIITVVYPKKLSYESRSLFDVINRETSLLNIF